ncbi:MAG: MoxR family ATPase [SAR92 clade bacterium]|uniref:MoxR family ATPase n=1 Tax=SAR92 clade bacterium TaxID=2315479 RepID=A0A520LMU1_9GAMM|nr:MAG: MoxR family ATPase [SAR92 clade bacterium]
MIENIKQLQTWLDTKIIGQEHLVERLIVALLSDGHVLVEGAPGLAKTKAIKTLSECLEADFHRIQFTPDLLPADVTGSDIYKPKDGNFEFQRGPIFHNLVLADEINRAPAKVQSALLEAMAERQISVGKNTYRLPDLFLVMATQNPIEQEGTYTLPEAQMDRFLLHVKVDYPAAGSERKILDLSREEQNLNFKSFEKPLTQLELDKARKSVRDVHMSEQVEEYLVQIVLATRNSDKYGGDLNNWLEYGASPRATIALDVCSKALAWLNNKDFVSPDDIRSVAHDILRHRIILSFEAEANGVSSDQVIDELLRVVPSA